MAFLRMFGVGQEGWRTEFGWTGLARSRSMESEQGGLPEHTKPQRKRNAQNYGASMQNCTYSEHFFNRRALLLVGTNSKESIKTCEKVAAKLNSLVVRGFCKSLYCRGHRQENIRKKRPTVYVTEHRFHSKIKKRSSSASKVNYYPVQQTLWTDLDAVNLGDFPESVQEEPSLYYDDRFRM
eukprot:4486504-Amphidinium_carterae.1